MQNVALIRLGQPVLAVQAPAHRLQVSLQAACILTRLTATTAFGHSETRCYSARKTPPLVYIFEALPTGITSFSLDSAKGNLAFTLSVAIHDDEIKKLEDVIHPDEIEISRNRCSLTLPGNQVERMKNLLKDLRKGSLPWIELYSLIRWRLFFF